MRSSEDQHQNRPTWRRNLLITLSGIILLIVVGGAASMMGSLKPSPDGLGTVDAFLVPVTVPSVDTSTNRYVMNGQPYLISRNYILSMSKNGDGTVGAMSLAAFLPDFSGLIPSKVRCLNFLDSCSGDFISITVVPGESPTNGAKQLENIRLLSHDDIRKGSCDFEYYESRGVPEQAFQHFFRKFDSNSDIFILRCPKK